jgi:hypothetical protein
MRVRLTTDDDGRICMESPYDTGLVACLKLAIPYDGRSWDPSRKRWLISMLYEAELLDVLQQCQADVRDDRASAGPLAAVPPMPPDLKEAFDALFLAYDAPLCVAEGSFRALSKYFHPDRGGDPEAFHHVNDAINIVRKYLDPKPESTDDDHLPF